MLIVNCYKNDDDSIEFKIYVYLDVRLHKLFYLEYVYKNCFADDYTHTKAVKKQNKEIKEGYKETG